MAATIVAHKQKVVDGLGAIERVTSRASARAASVRAQKRRGLTLLRSGAKAKANSKCPTCAKAAAFLKSEAKVLHSSVLSVAAATSMGSDAIDDVIDSLKGLIKRIDQEHKTEKEHKEWCEEETGLTTKKRDDHSYAIEDIKQVVAGLKELIDMKKNDIDEKEEVIDDEDTSWEERTDLRGEEKGEHEEDLEDHNV